MFMRFQDKRETLGIHDSRALVPLAGGAVFVIALSLARIHLSASQDRDNLSSSETGIDLGKQIQCTRINSTCLF